MQLTYDRDANVAYLRVRESQGDVETVDANGDVSIDIGESGRVCGIEFLNAREQLEQTDDGRFVLVNPLSGETAELKVA
jgi:uncharacterized protein YuzE